MSIIILTLLLGASGWTISYYIGLNVGAPDAILFSICFYGALISATLLTFVARNSKHKTEE